MNKRGDGNVRLERGLRNEAEIQEPKVNHDCFMSNPGTWEEKMEQFPKYVRRQNLTRFLALYELFKRVLGIKGSIVECGVHQGFGIAAWMKLAAILEPVNLTRRIYGFDTFSGFPSVTSNDATSLSKDVKAGGLAADSKAELEALVAAHDSTRFLGHIEKVELVKGDACSTIPQFIDSHPHLLVSLLFLDFDLYEPTKAALENFLPRMPYGAVLAFDELDNPLWPGETQAMLEHLSARRLKIERLPFDPYIGYAVLGS